MDGHIDLASRARVAGWARRVDGHPAQLVVEADGEIVATFEASAPRTDLGEDCGFSHRFSPTLVARELRIRYKDGPDLTGSPANLLWRAAPLAPEDLSWTNGRTPPDARQMAEIGSPDFETMMQQGTRMAMVIEQELVAFYGEVPASAKVLDFGCGIGRVALPLAHRCPRISLHACDVNPAAVAYLKRELRGGQVTKTKAIPPLSYPDNSYDCVYSISVWTHLPLGAQLNWLREIRRILKPGGVALISVSGKSTLQLRRAREAGWEDVTAQDVEEQGIIYKPYPLEGMPKGMDTPYGLTTHSRDWVMRVFDLVMPVLAIRPEALEGTQDLVVMTKV